MFNAGYICLDHKQVQCDGVSMPTAVVNSVVSYAIK